MAYLEEGFYSLGLKAISPDKQNFNNTKEITIRLTSDKTFDEIFDQLEFQETIELKGDMTEFGFFWITKISDGLYELIMVSMALESQISMLKIQKQEKDLNYFLLTIIINF